MILAPTLTLSAGSGAAIVRPTFSRDFAGEKTLNNGTGPAITFTRASNATFFNASGVLQTATNDQPRFDHDPATGASRGLLIEEARTNLLVRSEELDNASWPKGDCTVTANAATSPDGTSNADLAIPTTNNVATHRVTQVGGSVAAGSTMTASIYLKASGYNFVLLRCANSLETLAFQVGLNVSNGTISTAANAYGTGATVASAEIVAVGNGWYRASITGAISGLTTYGMFIYVYNAAGAPSFAGNGTSGVLLWGAQLEAGAFPTSYIPTTTAAATRSADSAVVTPISSFYNQSEGTLFAEASSLFVPASAEAGIFRLNSNSATNEVRIRFVNSLIAGQIHSSSGETASFTSSASSNVIYRCGLAYASNDAAFSVSGGSASTDASVSIPTVADRAVIGAGALAAGGFINGHIRRIAYWPKRLSNALLQQLTT